MKKSILALLTMLAFGQAHALNLSVKHEQKQWTLHDLNKTKNFRILLAGADHTLVNNADPLMTIEIFDNVPSAPLELGDEVKAWKAAVIGTRLDGKGSLSHQKLFKFEGEWRYYADMHSDSPGGTQVYSAVMAVVKDGHLVIFAFQQDKDLFFPRLEKIKKLYHKTKIDQI